jgi:hypothetical protein
VLRCGVGAARRAFADAGASEIAADLPQLGDVAQSGEPQAETVRPERLREALHVARAADRHDDDAFAAQVAAASSRERLECSLVAPAFDEDRRARLGGAREIQCGLRGERRPRAGHHAAAITLS